MKKKPSLLLLLLCAFCAVVWTASVLWRLIRGTYRGSLAGLGVDALCALILIAVFLLQMKRYRAWNAK